MSEGVVSPGAGCSFMGAERLEYGQTPISLAEAPFRVNVFVNGQPRQVADGTTVADLLAALQLPKRGVAVEVNQTIVPRIHHPEHPLHDGDRLEVVSLVGGG